jgi:hypothetical protein
LQLHIDRLAIFILIYVSMLELHDLDLLGDSSRGMYKCFVYVPKLDLIEYLSIGY